MGCEESMLSQRPAQTGRAKISSLKKNYKRVEQPLSYKNMEILAGSQYEMTQTDWDLVEDILLNHQLLFRARGYANKDIMNRLQKLSAHSNQIIFRKGDPSSYFYIIIKGKVEISQWASGEGTKTISRGDCFGDMGIYNKASRSATATAMTQVELLGLKKENFLRFSMELSKRAQREVFLDIKNVPIFKNLNLHQKHKIAYLAQQLRFKAGATIFKKGQIANCLYVVKTGRVRLNIPDRDSVDVKVKQCFGQSCLSQFNTERKAGAVCVQPTILLTFNKTDIAKYIGQELFDVQIINKFIWAVKHDKNLKVSPLVMESMIELREIKLFKNGQKIAQRGSAIKHFLISLQGGINDRPELQVFNTDFLFDIRFHTEDLIKRGEGRVAFISIEAVQSRYNRSFNSLIDLNQTIWRQIESVNKIQSYVASLNLNHFQVIDTVGFSAYGCTLQVRSESNIEFAMRVVDKSKAINEQMEEQVNNLRKVGGKLTHPLVAKQYRIFSDEFRIYFMNRWVQGEDLYDLLQRQRRVTPLIAKHFAACIINIMEYMHCRRILWRELKVQSFVIDHQGYLTLVDLMHLEELGADENSIINPGKATFLYLAPEVLAGHGYGFETDLWALGVVVYRMLVGEFPYGQKISIDDEKMLEYMTEEIQSKPLYFPNWLSSDAKIFLKILLNPNSFERSLITFTKLKSLTFFKDYDWLGLIEKKVKSIPYLPRKAAPKCSEPIHVSNWIQHQQSQLPPPSILDEDNETSKTSIR